MLKRRVAEATLDSYAARVRPGDLVPTAFRPDASRPSATKDADPRTRPVTGPKPFQMSR